MNTCSCLNLVLACIVYWQAREISRVLSQGDPLANGVDTSLLEHVSPIECRWQNGVMAHPCRILPGLVSHFFRFLASHGS
jgi:hypothetical protein